MNIFLTIGSVSYHYKQEKQDSKFVQRIKIFNANNFVYCAMNILQILAHSLKLTC